MTQLKWVPAGQTEVAPGPSHCMREQYGRGTAQQQQQQASGLGACLRRSAMHVRALLLLGGIGTAPSACAGSRL